jgi:hypothetical protein
MTDVSRELSGHLQSHYGIETTSIRPGVRGFVAETYVVEAADATYFVKYIPISRYSVNVEAGLSIQEELYEGGIEQMSRPVPTASGDLSVRLPDRLL